MKKQTVRNEGTIKRYSCLLVTVEKFKERYVNTQNFVIDAESLTQGFFNDLLHYMIKDHKYYEAATPYA